MLQMQRQKQRNRGMANQDLIRFIREARKRGFSDSEIREPLEKQGWSDREIDNAFKAVKLRGRVTVHINIDEEVYKVIQKRAKHNLMSNQEQIEDIIRRSAVTTKGKVLHPEKIDDLLVSIFSRRKYKKGK